MLNLENLVDKYLLFEIKLFFSVSVPDSALGVILNFLCCRGGEFEP